MIDAVPTLNRHSILPGNTLKQIKYCVLTLFLFTFSHPVLAMQAAGQVELIDAGNAPREVLRFKVKEGQEETMRMEMQMNMEMKELGQSMAMPAMQMEMKMRVLEVLPNGNIRYSFIFEDAGVKEEEGSDPMMVNGMNQSMQLMENMSGEALVSDRGVTLEAKIIPPPGMVPQTQQLMNNMNQTLNQISAPLPVEPVGEGAKWVYTVAVSQDIISVEQKVSYELLSRDGNTLNLRITITQTAPEQSLGAAEMVSIKSLEGEGEGDIKLGLGKLVPLLSNMSMKSTMIMSSSRLQEQGTMTMVTGMNVKIESE